MLYGPFSNACAEHSGSYQQMKKSKMPKTFSAFLIAVGLAFTLKQPQTTTGMIEVKGQDGACPLGEVNDECHLTSDGPVCTFTIGSNIYEAIPKESKDCETALVLHRPY